MGRPRNVSSTAVVEGDAGIGTSCANTVKNTFAGSAVRPIPKWPRVDSVIRRLRADSRRNKLIVHLRTPCRWRSGHLLVRHDPGLSVVGQSMASWPFVWPAPPDVGTNLANHGPVPG
jgi:hypothetical protein